MPNFFALPDDGHIPPTTRWVLVGVSLAIVGLMTASILLHVRYLGPVAVTVGPAWMIGAGAWILLAGLRWASTHPRHEDYWPTMVGVAAGFGGLIVGSGLLYYGLGVFESCGCGCSRQVKSFRDCVYFSVVTLTTVGYGDITPDGWSRLVAAVEALTGYLLLGLIVSILYGMFMAPVPAPAPATTDQRG